jgi:hypothetical protein
VRRLILLAFVALLLLVSCAEKNDITPQTAPRFEDPASWMVETTPAPTTTRVTRPRAARTEVRRIPLAQRSRCGSLEDVKRMESGGDYSAVNRQNNRHFGAYQFNRSTWRGAVSRAGYPEYAETRPDQAPPHVQDAAARQLYAERGFQPWAVC